MSDQFDTAKIVTPDGRVGFDAVKLASIPTEGIFLRNCPNHTIYVQTINTLYTLTKKGEKVTIIATKEDGSTPTYVPTETEVDVAGSTWGGSMLKMDYIGVNMHMEFYQKGQRGITTSEIQNIRIVDHSKVAAEAQA